MACEKVPKNKKQSTIGGCDGGCRRWWQCEATACEKVPKKKAGKQDNNQLELAVMAAAGGGGSSSQQPMRKYNKRKKVPCC